MGPSMNLRSFVAALLTLFGAAIILLTIYLGVQFNNELRDTIDDQKAFKKDLDKKVEALKERLALLVDGPLSKLVSIEATKVELVGQKAQRDNADGEKELLQSYVYSYWITVPNNRKADIEKVEYRRGPGDKLRSVLTGFESTNGFGVTYTGWGCFGLVDVKIIEKSGKETDLTFNDCQKIRANI